MLFPITVIVVSRSEGPAGVTEFFINSSISDYTIQSVVLDIAAAELPE